MTFKAIDSVEIQSFLSTRPNYKIHQLNAQRLYGPKSDELLKEPAKGSEVYIYGLPPDCYEDELVPILETVGTVYQLRIKVTFSGFGEGYAYVKYCDPFVAQRAVFELRKRRIYRLNRNGEIFYNQMRANLSYDNRLLRVDGLPEIKVEDVVEFISHGLVNYWYRKPEANGQNATSDGDLTLLFESHRDASMARRRWVDCADVGFCSSHQLDWVPPREWMDTVTTILVRKYEILVEHRSLKHFFKFGTYQVKEAVVGRDGVALVTYRTRWEARQAFKYCLDLGQRFPIEVCWARL